MRREEEEEGKGIKKTAEKKVEGHWRLLSLVHCLNLESDISLSPSCTNFSMVNLNSNHNRKAILGVIFPGLLSWSIKKLPQCIPNSTLPSESHVMKFSTSGLVPDTGPKMAQ